MLGVGRLPPPLCPPTPTTKTTFNVSSFLCHKKHSFISPNLHHFNNYAALFTMKQTGLCLFAQKRNQNSNFNEPELESQDFDDGFDVDEDELDDGFDDDEVEDEFMVPFKKMDAWFKKKPKGFGEGKVYDTSIEDELLEELEKIREAQLVNVEKLKNNNSAKLPDTQNELKRDVKATEVSPGCVRVRINNLPKKKNIHRDLKSAFKGVHGIDKILPMVSGTKKTRDPVCKGFAFVDFKSLDDANRFLQTFSSQSIAFGKTEKTIKCEILKLSNDEYDNISEPSMAVVENKGDQVDGVVLHDAELDSWEEEVLDDLDDFDDLDDGFDDEDITGSFKPLHSTNLSKIESLESTLLKQLSDNGSLSTKKKEKKVGMKKPAVQKNFVCASKIEVPKSAQRFTQAWEDDFDDNVFEPSMAAVENKGDHVGEVVAELDEWEDDDFDDSNEDDSDDEDIPGSLKLSNSTDLIKIKSLESRLLKKLSDDDSSSAKKKEKVGKKKKPAVQKNPVSATKIKVPGSAQRLKVHEKAKLADVYSRYGSKQESLASKET